jgi:ubiquinone biosynthesis protein Coq4
MNNREKLCHFLFQKSAGPYAAIFKRNQSAWNLSSSDLLKYPQSSLGHQVGVFLSTNGFEFFPKHETHDVFHVVCNYGVSVKEEIGLQFLLFGNGKRSLYLYVVMCLGLFIVPEYATFYKKSFNKGKSQPKFHHKISKAFLVEQYDEVKLRVKFSDGERELKCN